MSEASGHAPRGAFQWNAGGWFGAQVGSTIWLLLLGALVMPGRPGVGAAVVACGAIPNALGTALWLRRSELDPHLALQLLIGCMGVCAAAALVLLDVRGSEPLASHLQPSPQRVYWILAMYPGLMAVFWLRQRAALRGS